MAEKTKIDAAAKAKKLQERRNARFRALDPEEKRVAVAKDVLQQLEAEKIVATRGVYVDARGITDKVFDAGTELQDVLFEGQGVTCDACAVGSLFLSTVRMQNDFKIPGTGGGIGYHDGTIGGIVRDDMADYLDDIFTRGQLRNMEDAFEVSPSEKSYRDLISEYGYTEREAFGMQFRNPDDRLTAIMRNVIKHEGRFSPEDPQKDQKTYFPKERSKSNEEASRGSRSPRA